MARPIPVQRRLLILAVGAAALAAAGGCNGASSRGAPDDSEDAGPPPAVIDAGPDLGDEEPDAGPPLRTLSPADEPAAGGEDARDRTDPLPFATAGVRCVDGRRAPFLVLSSSGAACDAHVAAFDPPDDPALDPTGLVSVRLPDDAGAEPLEITAPGLVCDVDGCIERDVRLELDPFVPDEAPVTGTYRYDYQDADGESRERSGRIDAGWCAFDELFPPPRGDTPVRGLSIDEVSINQGVRTVLTEDGPATVMPESDPAFDTVVIAGRRGLLRVTVTPDAESGFAPRNVLARLDLGGGDVREQVLLVDGASSLEDNGDGTFAYENTFVFPLSGDDVTTSTRYAVSLWEVPACADVDGPVGRTRFPILTGNFADLGAQDPVGALDVVLVPMRYTADGSSRVPDTSPEAVAGYRDLMFETYPVAEVSMTVREPVDLEIDGDPPDPITVSRNGSGWSSFLFACRQLRLDDGVPEDTYYYCIVNPGSTFRNYCGGGCVAGLGTLPSPTQTALRASVGLGYLGRAEEIFIHELGHNHGRRHTPCGGPAGVDGNYPYAGARLGNVGYRILAENEVLPTSVPLIPANRARDFMSYCDPTWTSDYTWSALFTRNVAVETLAAASSLAVAGPPERWRTAAVDADGSLRWLDREGTVLRQSPGGQPRQGVWWARPGGDAVALDALYAPFDHLDGGFLHVRDPGGPGGPTTGGDLVLDGAAALPW